MTRNGVPHNRCRRFVKAVQFLRAVQARAVRIAGAPVIPLTQNCLRLNIRMIAEQNTLTGHGHAAEMPALVAEPFGNEQKMGILAQL